MDLQFNSIDQCVCFLTNTMLFLLLQFCSPIFDKDSDTSRSSIITQNFAFIYPEFFCASTFS